MLTDYHLHLRPDEDGTTFEQYFTAGNVARYREAADAAGIAELGVSEHVYRFRQALDVWEHPLWVETAADDLDAYCEFVRGETGLKLGIEADFIPGREDRMAGVLDGRDWDYVVGSIHFLRDEALDHEGWDIWKTSFDRPEKVWATYFEWLAEAARTGMFDIMAHPDLVKVWGKERPAPEGDLRRFYEPAVEAFAETGVAVEVSTAGWRKPVGEIYPAGPFLEMLLDAGCPLALSSDAHVPEQVGFQYERAVAWLREHGVTEIAVFDRRERRMEPLG